MVGHWVVVFAVAARDFTEQVSKQGFKRYLWNNYWETSSNHIIAEQLRNMFHKYTQHLSLSLFFRALSSLPIHSCDDQYGIALTRQVVWHTMHISMAPITKGSKGSGNGWDHWSTVGALSSSVFSTILCQQSSSHCSYVSARFFAMWNIDISNESNTCNAVLSPCSFRRVSVQAVAKTLIARCSTRWPPGGKIGIL